MKRLLVLASLLSLILPNTAFAAIAFDNSSWGGGTSVSGQQSWSTSITGTNVALLVGCQDASGAGGDTVLTVKVAQGAGSYVDATKVTTNQVPSDRWNSLWLLTGLSTASTSIEVTESGTHLACFAASYSGVKTTGQPAVTSTATVTSNTTFNSTLTTSANANGWLVGYENASGFSTPPITAGTATAVRTPAGSSAMGAFADSNGALPANTSETIQIHYSVADTGMFISVYLEPAVTPASAVKVPDILWWGWKSLGL